MPTIKQLPAATSVNATDVLPISQGGTTKALMVGDLLSSTQAALSLVAGKLLGRVSGTAGGPEVVSVGVGLVLDSGALSATGADHVGLPLSSALGPLDEVVVNSGGFARRIAATALRGLFSAGPGVTISGGTISAAGSSYMLPPATNASLGGVKVDGSSIVVDGSGVISSVAATPFSLPAVLGSAGAPPPITATGATFTLQNGNLAASDLPGSPAAYDGFRSVLLLQPGSNVGQVSALGGYVLNRAAYVTNGNKNAAAALWGESVADIDGARSWGLLLNVNDGTGGGTGAGRLLSSEIDVGVTHAQTAAVGLSVNANFFVQPGGADGFVVTTAGSVTDATLPRWVNGISVRAGAAAAAIRVGATAGVGARGSMPLVLESVDGSGTVRTARLEAAGDATALVTAPGLTVQAAAGQSYVSFSAIGQTLPAASGGVSGSQPLILSGRDASGATVAVTIRADAAGNAVVTGGDILFQIAGAVRLNGAALLTSAAVPAAGGLLGSSGTAGAAQPATTAQFEALMTAWLQGKATAPAATPGWWNNSGNPTYS